MSKKERSGRFEEFGAAARRLLEQRLGSKLTDYEAVQMWPRAVGSKIAERCIALGIKSGILSISVPNHVWLTEMKALKNRLIKSVNEKMGREVVKDLNFQVGVSKRKK